MHRQSVVALLAGAIVLSACSGSTSTATKHPTPTSTAAAPGTTTTAPPVPTTTAASTITGIGATDAAWETHHTRDHRFAAGSSYDPDPTVDFGSDPMRDDKYYAVIHQGGHVTGYSMRFPHATTIAQAQMAVLAELPPDGAVAWSATKDVCAQAQLRSATLGSALRAADPSGGVLATFWSDTANVGPYSADNVIDATVLPLDDATAADAPSC